MIYNIEEIDFHTVNLIYVNIIGGCVFSMGLKYAGTCDEQTSLTILKQITFLKSIQIENNNLISDPATKNCLDQYTVNNLLCVCALSLSIIQAGGCDIKIFKAIKSIKKRIQESTVASYGFNMAINMALGFLFLGHGR